MVTSYNVGTVHWMNVKACEQPNMLRGETIGVEIGGQKANGLTAGALSALNM